jgi:hypothetical protein
MTHFTQNEQNKETRDFEKSMDSKSAAIFYVTIQIPPFASQTKSGLQTKLK